VQQIIPIALYGWVGVSIILFWVIPPRRAAIVSLIAGWALLPLGQLPPDLIDRPWGDSFIATCYPSRFLLTKATIIGASVLLGMILRDGKRMLALRPRWFDLPLVVWCVCPVFSAMRNSLSVTDGLMLAGYLALSWGGPYVAGRVYFSDAAGLRDFVNGLIIAGLAYVPVCLVESIYKPLAYVSVYGSHPWQLEGAERWIGWRPLGFLDHGNGFGMWMAGAALVSIWMWRAKAKPVAGGWGAGILAVATLMTQSVGPVLLVLLALAAQWLLPRWSLRVRRSVGIGSAIAMLMLVLAMTVGAGPLRRMAVNVLGEQGLRRVYETARLKSAGSRLSMAARSGQTLRERPIFGWGRWDWYEEGRPPWSLLLLALGLGGAIGMFAMMLTMLLSVAMFLRRFAPDLWGRPVLAAASALMALMAVSAVDCVLNPTFNLVVLAAGAGLAAGSAHETSSA